MISKTSAAILRVFFGFILGYVVAIISIVVCDKSDSIPRPVLQSLLAKPISEWLRDSDSLMASYSLGDKNREGISFKLSRAEAKRLGDALASDLPSVSHEGRLTFRDHFDLVFLGSAGLHKIKYDVTTGAARISSEGFEDLTVKNTSFFRALLPIIQEAEQAASSNHHQPPSSDDHQ